MHTTRIVSVTTAADMKFSVLTCVVAFAMVIAAATAAAAAAGDRYTTKYDNVNVDEILGNERLFKQYFNCVIDKGSCTPDAAELKKTIKDALETQCSKCSDKQKAGSEKVFRFLIEKKPKEFAILEQKYDPQGVYKKRYQAEAAKRGIKLPA